MDGGPSSPSSGIAEIEERKQGSTRYTRGRIWIQRIDWLSTQSNKFSINIDLDYVLL